MSYVPTPQNVLDRLGLDGAVTPEYSQTGLSLDKIQRYIDAGEAEVTAAVNATGVSLDAPGAVTTQQVKNAIISYALVQCRDFVTVSPGSELYERAWEQWKYVIERITSGSETIAGGGIRAKSNSSSDSRRTFAGQSRSKRWGTF